VVELDGDLVVKHVSPETSSGVITIVQELAVKEFANRGHQATTHQRELVVDQSSIQSSNKGSRDGSEKDKGNNSVSSALEALQDGVVDNRSDGLIGINRYLLRTSFRSRGMK
jgi:prophage tail gpP-like protein